MSRLTPIDPSQAEGKAKTLLQNIAIGALLFHYTTLGLPAQAIGLAFLLAATVLTLVSGYAYFADFFRDAASDENPGRIET